MELTSATLLIRLKGEGPPRELAWAEFRERYAPVIAGFARRLGAAPHDVDDIIQDVLTGFFAAQPVFAYNPALGRFRGYLKTCVVRAIAAKKRGRLRLDGRPIEEVDVADESLDRAWETCWDQEVLAQAVERLREYHQDDAKFRAFVRTAIDGVPAQAVADELGMGVDAVYLAKSRCIARLRLMIQTVEGDEE